MTVCALFASNCCCNIVICTCWLWKCCIVKRDNNKCSQRLHSLAIIHKINHIHCWCFIIVIKFDIWWLQLINCAHFTNKYTLSIDNSNFSEFIFWSFWMRMWLYLLQWNNLSIWVIKTSQQCTSLTPNLFKSSLVRIRRHLPLIKRIFRSAGWYSTRWQFCSSQNKRDLQKRKRRSEQINYSFMPICQNYQRNIEWTDYRKKHEQSAYTSVPNLSYRADIIDAVGAVICLCLSFSHKQSTINAIESAINFCITWYLESRAIHNRRGTLLIANKLSAIILRSTPSSGIYARITIQFWSTQHILTVCVFFSLNTSYPLHIISELLVPHSCLCTVGCIL